MLKPLVLRLLESTSLSKCPFWFQMPICTPLRHGGRTRQRRERDCLIGIGGGTGRLARYSPADVHRVGMQCAPAHTSPPARGFLLPRVFFFHSESRNESRAAARLHVSQFTSKPPNNVARRATKSAFFSFYNDGGGAGVSATLALARRHRARRAPAKTDQASRVARRRRRTPHSSRT